VTTGRERIRSVGPSSEEKMRIALLFFFFLSGVSALMYQVIWVRMLGLVFGVTSLAVTTVLSAFMAGLALGNYCGGRFIDRRKDPLLVFAVIELSIGVFALLFPVLLSCLKVAYILIYRQWPTSLYVFSLLRFVLAFSLLLVPTTLMGATLPVLAKFFVKKLNKLGSDMGNLYSVNNLGAVLGALAAGFILIEILGVRETSWLAAAISIGIGFSSWYLHSHGLTLSSAALTTEDRGQPAGHPASAPPENRNREADDSGATAKENESDIYPQYVLVVVLIVFGIEGFTSLAYEVIWTRILSGLGVVITVYSYSLVVATFIAGLAIGSFLIARVIDKRRDLLILLAGIEIAIGVSALLLLPMFRIVEPGVYGGQISNWWELVATTALWLGMLMIVPTTLMGATFPIVSKIYTINFKQLGRRIGKIGCLDTVGSVFGAFAGGFILIPLFGMQMSVVLLALVNMVIGAAVLLSHPRMRLSRKGVALAGLVALGVGGWFFIPHRVTFEPITDWSNRVLIHYDEGIGATVTVHQTSFGDRTLEVNGICVAGKGESLKPTQIVQGHLPLLIYEGLNGEEPRRALTIGLGSGHTSWCLSQHDLDEIHCVELVPGVERAARKYFRMLNHDVFSDPRYRVFIQDARTLILSTDKQYDVIMDDAVHPCYAGNASLYTVDFFSQCRKRLSDKGVMSLWVPFFLISPGDLKMIFKSFQKVFPHATLWYATRNENIHALLVGTQRKLAIDFARFQKRFHDPRVLNAFAEIDLDNVFAVLNCLLLDEKALREYSKGARVHSDDHPYLEYSTPRARVLGDAVLAENLTRLGRRRSSILPCLYGLGGTDEGIASNKQRLSRNYELNGYLLRAWISVLKSNLQEAIREGEQALALDHNDKRSRKLVSMAYSYQATFDWQATRLAEARKRCEKSLEYDPDNVYAINLLSRILVAEGRLDEAIELMQKGMQRVPDYAAGRLFLAGCYARKGMLQEARKQLKEFLEVLPGEPTALHYLRLLEPPGK